MIRPFTCLTLVAACGAGLYLYQVKHRAQMVDRNITQTVRLTEQARNRISLLKTELATLTTPARLSALVAEHLQLQPTQPTQYVRLEDLRGRLPPIMPPSATPAPVEEAPMAAATPLAPARLSSPPLPMLAMIQPPAPAPMAPKLATPVAVRPVQSIAPVVSLAATVKLPLPAPAVTPVQMAAAHPAPRPVPAHVLVAALAKPREAEPMQREAAVKEPAMREPVVREPVVREFAVREAAALPPRRLFAPVMPAYAPTALVVHAPTVQTASAVTQSSPFVGSALGMAHTVLAAPVPVKAAYPSGQ